jgi:hypothetical protein
MALRPTELQIILAATRDIEKVQQVQQHLPRSQQEQLALQFQHEVQERKRQAQSTTKTEESQLKHIEVENKRKQTPHRRGKADEQELEGDSKTALGKDSASPNDHVIDLLI